MKSTLSSFECGLLELNKGNLDLAESLFRISLLTDGDTPDCLTNLGIVLKQKGLLDDSQSFYEHSLTISPDNVATLYNLGLLYFAKSENALAELTYERAYAIDPENIDVVIQLCRNNNNWFFIFKCYNFRKLSMMMSIYFKNFTSKRLKFFS